MSRQQKQRVPARRLHDLAVIEHCDAIAEMRRDPDVAGDEQHCTVVLGRQLAQQVKDLRLDRDVKPARGVIRDHEGRVADQRDGDHSALGHAARELVRIGIHAAFGIRDLDSPQHLEGLSELELIAVDG